MASGHYITNLFIAIVTNMEYTIQTDTPGHVNRAFEHPCMCIQSHYYDFTPRVEHT